MAAVFQGIKLFRSTTNLMYKNQAWCSLNADLLYEGPNQAYSDTNTLGNTLYYYKIFSEYLDGSVTSFSEGVMVSVQTPRTPTWQDWPNLPGIASKPYQVIYDDPTDVVHSTHLHRSDYPYYIAVNGSSISLYCKGNCDFYGHNSQFQSWEFLGGYTPANYGAGPSFLLSQVNNIFPVIISTTDIYTSATLTTVLIPGIEYDNYA